jgi:hypothetical protein
VGGRRGRRRPAPARRDPAGATRSTGCHASRHSGRATNTPGGAAAGVPGARARRPAGAVCLLVGGGATVSLPVTFQLLDNTHIYLVIGLLGTALAVVWLARSGCRLADDDEQSVTATTYVDVLRHGGHDVAFVTVWVAVAYLAWSVVTHATGFDGSQLPLHGLLGVVVGATIGLVPGCAVQIVFAGIFTAGGMPMATLLANTVSQDGDALLLLLALAHRSALLATALTTIPALLVVTCLLVLT